MAVAYTNLDTQLTSYENLFWAFKKAARGKRGLESVADFAFDEDANLFQLQEELQAKSYQPGPYHSFYIRDPKRRLVSAAPFRDRVVHHALCNVIEPIFERTFIGDSYANRVGKGTHAALDRAQGFAKAYPYVLQCDVRQCFPSLDHQILRTILARKIHADDTLWLCDQVLKSGEGVLEEEYEMVYFPGDDLFAVNRPRGLPIGVRRESVLNDCSAQKCRPNLLFHQQYPMRYRGKAMSRVKPANNVPAVSILLPIREVKAGLQASMRSGARVE